MAKDHTAYLAGIFNKFSVTLVRGIGHNSYIIGFTKCSGLEGGKIFKNVGKKNTVLGGLSPHS